MAEIEEAVYSRLTTTAAVTAIVGAGSASRIYLEDGRALEIDGVINRLERDEMLELMCRELVNA